MISLTGILIALGAIVWILEEFIPRVLPWAKPGLANIATLIAIVTAGTVVGFFVSIGRVFLGALLLGRIGSVSFLMSLVGALSAFVIMSVLMKINSPFSIYGISIWGAIFHGLSQLLLAIGLVYSGVSMLNLIPPILIPAVLSGILVGFLASKIISINRMKNIMNSKY